MKATTIGNSLPAKMEISEPLLRVVDWDVGQSLRQHDRMMRCIYKEIVVWLSS